jgi:glycosyltransferase involved in cell wall biosynthesis
LLRIAGLRTRRKLIVYTTYEPVNLLVGYISKKFGLSWIADIWDDPEKIVMIAQSVDHGLKNRIILALRKLEHFIPKTALKKSDLCITLIKPELIEKYRVPEKQIYSLTNGVNVDIDYPEAPDDNRLFALNYVGPMERTRTKHLPDVLDKLFHKIMGFKIYLIGSDVKGGTNWLKTKLVNLSTVAEINITGRLPHEQVLNIIARTDVSLCLYPNEADLNPAYPIKIFESMIMGKPVVATRLRGISEIINHEVNGFLVEPGDIDQAVGILVRLKEDPMLRKRIGKAAKKRAYEFDWKVIHNMLGKRLESFIERMVTAERI